MRYLSVLLILLAFACKKEATEQSTPTPNPGPQNPQPISCDEGRYGTNCENYYGDLLRGTWIVSETCFFKYSQETPKIEDSLVSTHECQIYDSILVSGGDTFRWYYMSNFWGNGEVANVIAIDADSMKIGMPRYRSKISSQPSYFYVGPIKGYAHNKFSAFMYANSKGGESSAQTWINISMRRK